MKNTILYFLLPFFYLTGVVHSNEILNGSEIKPINPDEKAAFISLFKSREITNLHIYINQGNKEDYPYAGSSISPAFSHFFAPHLRNRFYDEELQPRAVLNFHSGEQEYFILYLPNKNWSSEIALFGWSKGILQKEQTIAYYQCKDMQCIQKDSWILDVNGDMMLDIVRKKKFIGEDGKAKTRTTVFLADRKGGFEPTNEKPDIYYKMKKMD